MKVSVIITTYNRANMVTEAIDSILNQTLKDFELIVVDNVSSDNTEDVIKAYTDERISYFKHRNNGVIAVNRNFAIKKAKGEYIAFCDDDDLWMPEKLERQVQEYEKDNQIGLVCTNGIDFDSKGEHGEREKTKLKDSDFTFESLILNNHISCPSVLVKKKVIDDVGMFDESPIISTCEDYELWLRIAKKYRVKYIGLPLIKYRTHPGAYRYTKSYIGASERDKEVYRILLGKKILNSQLYQKRIAKLDRQILLGKLLKYNWVIKHASFLMQIIRTIAHGVRRISKRDV